MSIPSFDTLKSASTETRQAMRADNGTGTDYSAHNAAVNYPVTGTEASLVCMLHSWAFYARCYEMHHGVTIGLDTTLAGPWGTMGDSLLGLLDGDTGRLDIGTLDCFIRATMLYNDIEPE